MRITRKCKGCGEQIHKDEMIQYASATGKTLSWYCKPCYEEKLARERFINKVCKIFQLKSPGPVIWTQRKRLQQQYGYTDDTIVDCLEFLYEVQKKGTLIESLGLITPKTVAAMKVWKSKQRALGGRLIAALDNTEIKERIINEIPEPKSTKKEISLDDGLYDD